MASTKRISSRSRASSTKAGSKKKIFSRWWLVAGLMVLAVVGLLAVKGDLFRADSGDLGVAISEGKPDWSPLIGDWVRADGGYVIKITEVDPDGGVHAGYFNPRPISVSRAVALVKEGKVGLLIELRDKGYPGSTYTLTYNEKADALAGIYYQAALGQSFEVVFFRKK